MRRLRRLFTRQWAVERRIDQDSLHVSYVLSRHWTRPTAWLFSRFTAWGLPPGHSIVIKRRAS